MANDYRDKKDRKFGLKSALPEDNVQQRIALAGGVSLIVNIALLSGAGALAHNMGKTPPSVANKNIEVALIQATPEPTPTPIPTPTPEPTPQTEPTPVPTPDAVQPTPAPRERVRPTPQPTPRPQRVVPTPEAVLPTPEPAERPTPEPVRPTPRPEQPRPTPQPTPDVTPTERVVPTPSPARPVETPQVARQQPASQPNQVASANTNAIRTNSQSIQRENPALATTPTNANTPRSLQTNTARRGNLPATTVLAAGPLSSRPSANTTGTAGDFTVPSNQVARLPGPAAARNGVADVKLGASAAGTISTVTAAPSIETTSTERTRQLTTSGGRRIRGSDATAVMTTRSNAPNAGANFSVPSGSLRAGTATAVQGRALGSGAVASVSGGPGTQAYAGPEFSVTAPGLRASGAPGVARTRGRLSPNVGAPLNERTGRLSPDGTYGVVGPNTGGTRVAAAAVRGNSTGSYNPAGVAGGSGPGVRSGTGPSYNGGSENGTTGGRNRGIAGTPGGRGTGLRGSAITGTGDGRPTGSGTGRGGGVAGVPNGAIGGTGNGRTFQAGTSKGSASGKGVGEGSGPGFAAGNGPSVASGGGREAPRIVANTSIPTEASGQSKNTRDAEAISQPEIDFPESVRGQNFSSSVVARVTIYANGTSSATLTKDSGNAEVDRAVLNTLKRWKWKAAIQDGSPVTSTKSVNIRLSNK